MYGISNIYSVLQKDFQNTYFKNKIRVDQLSPIGIISDSTFDSTIGNIEDKIVTIRFVDDESINSIDNKSILYISGGIFLYLIFKSNSEIRCKVIFGNSNNYNIKNSLVYKIDQNIDSFKNQFNYNNKIKSFSQVESIKFLENNDIYSFINQDMTTLIYDNSVNISINNITNFNIRVSITNMYLNIQLFSYHIVSNFFNISNIKENNTFVGSIYHFFNTFLDSRPHYSVRLADFPININLNKLNRYTKYEKNIDKYDKFIMVLNFSVFNLSELYSFFNLKTGYFYKILK